MKITCPLSLLVVIAFARRRTISSDDNIGKINKISQAMNSRLLLWTPNRKIQRNLPGGQTTRKWEMPIWLQLLLETLQRSRIKQWFAYLLIYFVSPTITPPATIPKRISSPKEPSKWVHPGRKPLPSSFWRSWRGRISKIESAYNTTYARSPCNELLCVQINVSQLTVTLQRQG